MEKANRLEYKAAMSNVSIEGSAERAADRGRDFFDPISGSKPFLGSPDVLDALVRSFLGKLVDIRIAYNSDQIEGTEASKQIAALCESHAATVTGRNADYEAAKWNSDEQLGAFLAAMFTDVAADRGAHTFFYKLAGDFITGVIIPAENEELTDESGSFRTDVLVEEAVAALQGLQIDINE
jgi:hypothetical protein